MSLVLEDGSNTLLQQPGPCAEPPAANTAVSGLGAASVSGLPRSPLLRGGLPGADQLLCRALPSSVVSVLSRPTAPGAGSAVRRQGRFDLEEAALGKRNSSHTRRFLMCSEAANELGFEISTARAPNPKAKLPGTSPWRGRTKGMCASTPLKLRRRVTELRSAEPGGAGALRFALWNL